MRVSVRYTPRSQPQPRYLLAQSRARDHDSELVLHCGHYQPPIRLAPSHSLLFGKLYHNIGIEGCDCQVGRLE